MVLLYLCVNHLPIYIAITSCVYYMKLAFKYNTFPNKQVYLCHQVQADTSSFHAFTKLGGWWFGSRGTGLCHLVQAHGLRTTVCQHGCTASVSDLARFLPLDASDLPSHLRLSTRKKRAVM